MEAELIGPIASHRGGFSPDPVFATLVGVGQQSHGLVGTVGMETDIAGHVRRLAARTWCFGLRFDGRFHETIIAVATGPRGILPFGLRWQPVDGLFGMCALCVEPSHLVLCVLPGHARDGPPVQVGLFGIGPALAQTSFRLALICIPLAVRDLEFSQCEFLDR